MAESSVPDPSRPEPNTPGASGAPGTPGPGVPDAAAVERDAAEEKSVFAHPAVEPDATEAYGPHPDQIVDFHAPRGGPDHPEGTGGAPLVVVFHGGAWRAPYDRRHISPFADFLARRGFAVANVEYRRGRDVPAPRTGPGGGTEATGGPVAGRWPETFDDVAAVMDALPELVARALPGTDIRRTVLTGHSAGGQLALWAAARHVLPRGSAWRLDRAPELRGVVALAPIADFERATALDVCGGAVRQLLGTGDDETAAAARRAAADPALLLPTGIATTVVQGYDDIVVPRPVAEAYVDAAARAGETVGLTLLAEAGHFPLIDPAADACAVVAEEIAQLAW